MDLLVRAARHWSELGAARAAAHLQHASPLPPPPPTAPALSVPHGSSKVHQQGGGDGDGLRVLASTPVSARPPRATEAAAVAAATAADSTDGSTGGSGLLHPRPVRSTRSVHTAGASKADAPASTPTPHESPSLLQKLWHHKQHAASAHSPKGDEEGGRHSAGHPLYKLSLGEPRPSGMPLRIYSSDSPSRAMWENVDRTPTPGSPMVQNRTNNQ